MKTNAERAQAQLTLMPKTVFTWKEDGFIGALYQPYAGPGEVPLHGHVSGRAEIPGTMLGERHGRF